MKKILYHQISLIISLLIIIFIFSINDIIKIKFLLITVLFFLLITELVFFSILRSIIEQKEYIEKITKKIQNAYETEKKVNTELKKIDNIKNQFILAIQHHLRTPLASIQGYIELILDGVYGEISNQMRNVIERVQKSTKNEIRVVEELLSISQFQMGKKIVNITPNVNISLIIKEIVDYLKIETKDKGIYLKFKENSNISNISADKSKIKIALVNIIDNSVKYTDKGGVTISIKEEKAKTGNKGKIIIKIKDTGIGIDKDNLKNLFSKFFERGQNAQKKFTTGKGIGLYISAKIIESHNGKVWAESKGENKGSIFYIQLPI